MLNLWINLGGRIACAIARQVFGHVLSVVWRLLANTSAVKRHSRRHVPWHRALLPRSPQQTLLQCLTWRWPRFGRPNNRLWFALNVSQLPSGMLLDDTFRIGPVALRWNSKPKLCKKLRKSNDTRTTRKQLILLTASFHVLPLPALFCSSALCVWGDHVPSARARSRVADPEIWYLRQRTC